MQKNYEEMSQSLTIEIPIAYKQQSQIDKQYA